MGINSVTAIQHMIYLLFTTTYQCYTKCTISCFYLNHLSHNLQKSLIRSPFKFSSINGLHLELVLNVFIVIFFFFFFYEISYFFGQNDERKGEIANVTNFVKMSSWTLQCLVLLEIHFVYWFTVSFYVYFNVFLVFIY